MLYKERVFLTASPLNQKEITKNSEDILKMRYFMEKLDGTKETTFSELARRVSRVLTSAETDEDIKYRNIIEQSIYNDIISQRFLFNSPCLFNAGIGISKNPKLSKYLYSDEADNETYDNIRKNISANQQLFACFVVSFTDSLENIFEAIKRTAIISKSGGGVGANLCRLREKGATIKNGELGVSSGPISFMNNFNECLKSVSQAGKRRGAGMLMLDSNHPDIKEFIDSKTEEGVLSNVNISVALDNKFMKAVKEDADYCLISPKDGSVVKTIKAKDLFNIICENAWKRGDPGIFFRQMANEDSLLKLNEDYEIFSTNPCCTGDTLVAVADGRGYVSIKELADEGKDVPVYCEDYNHNIVIKNMVHPRLTKKNADVLKITLDDGNIIKCTSNHKFEINTENGSVVKTANELKYGDSLKILTRKINTAPIKGNRKTKGYVELYNGNNVVPFLEHRLISEYYYGKDSIKDKVIHHKDFNSLNNNINNLIPMSYKEHIELHTKNMYGENNPMIRAKKEWSKEDWEEYHNNMSFAVSGEKNGRYRNEFSNEMLIHYMKELILILNRRPSIHEFDNYVFSKTNLHCKGLFASKYRLKALNINGYKDFSIRIAKELLYENKLANANYDIRTQKRIIKQYNDAINQGYNTFIYNNIVYIERKCEYCGNIFIEPYERREVMYCSQKCVANSVNHYNRETIEKRKKEYQNIINDNKNAQLLIYTELKMELGREPYKKEWIKKCKENDICIALGRTEGRFKTYNALKECANYYNHRVVSVEYFGTEDVYNGTVEEYHNYYIGGFDNSDENKQKLIFVKNFNCGEQPLPDESSCNLGSINLYEFIKDDKTFDWEDFKKQIIRAIYYLDLVIDATKYPLPIIERRTKAIRPVGLGIMGLADTMIELGIKYGSKESLEFCDKVSEYLALYSLIASIELAKQKGNFKEFNSTLHLLNQNVSYNKIIDNLNIQFDGDAKENFKSLSQEEIDNINWVKILLDKNDKYRDYIQINIYQQLIEEDNSLPLTFKNTLMLIEKMSMGIGMNCIYDLFNTGLRNSRRLSIAPTGCQVKNTYVNTDKGLLRLDEIGNIESENKWTDIDINVEQEKEKTNATKFYINGYQQTKKITLHSGLDLECTYNHQYRILSKDNEYKWRRADELKIGDKIVYKMGQCNITENPIFDFSWYKRHGNNDKHIIFPEQMTEDLAYFIGVYCGDGNHHDRELRVYFNIKDVDKMNKFSSIVKNCFNYDVIWCKDNREKLKNLSIACIRSTEIIKKLEYIGAIKENSVNVIIPKIIRCSTKECIKAFLEGYISADGSIQKNDHVYIDTVSERMAKELLMLMRYIGINGKIQIYTNRNNSLGNKSLYRVHFSGYGSDDFDKSKERYVLKHYRTEHKILSDISDRLYCDEITEIIDSENFTYDIEVPQNNTYIANSFVSHNTISMILNTSSAIEPNFAFEWDRYVVDVNGTDRVLKKFYHKLNTPDNRNKGLLITANELDWKEHIAIVKEFAQYIDSAISKTCNFKQNATVEEIKNLYMYCFDNNIKGTTIYRDGSRDSQPIISKDNKEEKIVTEKTDSEYNSLEKLPQWLPAIRVKTKTPYGSVYVIATFYKGRIVEIYINCGKLGGVIRSLCESVSRVLSIALRSNADISNIIKTLDEIAENEIWVYDTINGEEKIVKSIPDNVSKIIDDIINIVKDDNSLKKVICNINSNISDLLKSDNINANILVNTKTKRIATEIVTNNEGKEICPKCGSKMIKMGSCALCPSCSYSPCG